jgi:hypothetical protein
VSTREYLKACIDVYIEAGRVYADAAEGRSEADVLLAGGRMREAAKAMRRAEIAIEVGTPNRRMARELTSSEMRAARSTDRPPRLAKGRIRDDG